MTPAFSVRARPVYKDASTQTTFAASTQADNVRSATSAPHHWAFFRDLAAPFVPLSGKGQLADLQKQNAALTKELGKAIAGQTPKSDNETAHNTAAGNSMVNSHAALLLRSDSHAAFSVPNGMQAKENAAIAEIRKTLLERKRQHDSCANITCNYSPFIPPARMAQIIAETAEKLDMSSVTNVDTVTVFFQRGTTPHTTKAIAPLSGHVTAKVMKREAEKTKAPTSTPARPLPEPIEQREATYNKARKRISAQRPFNPAQTLGAVMTTNPWAILAETPEQTAMEFQSDVDVALARSDTVNKGDICRPSMTKTGLAPTSKSHSNKLRRKRRFTHKQLYQLWLQEMQLVTVCIPESHTENVTDNSTAVGNTKNLEKAVVSSNKGNRVIHGTEIACSCLPERSDADLGELPEIACTQSRALVSARKRRSRKSEKKRVAREQARARKYQTSQHAENTLTLTEQTQHFHTADVLATVLLCAAVTTTSATEKIVFMHMLHAANTAYCFWKSLMLLTLCYQQQRRADENNAQNLYLNDNSNTVEAERWVGRECSANQ